MAGTTREISVEVLRTPSTEIAALIDSNVLLDLYSCHDLMAAPLERVADRTRRARDAVLLAMHLDEARAVTASLQEPVAILATRVPPDAPTRELAFTLLFVNFVKDYIAPAWDDRVLTEADPRRNAADRYLDALAARAALPAITHDDDLTRLARRSGAEVYSPRAFLEEQGFDDAAGAQRFLRRFRAEQERFIRSSEGGELARPWVERVYDLYRRVLLGRG